MLKLSMVSLIALFSASALYLVFLFITDKYDSFFGFMLYLGVSFLFIGFLFGNLNTMAIQPLGHIAGTANSVISSLQTFISVLIGGSIGQLYDGTVIPLVTAFLVLSLLSMGMIIISRDV